MTKAEYGRRLAEIQADLVERSKAENARHDAELSCLRSDFQQKCLDLRKEFERL